MRRIVEPHDLEGECERSCDGSISELSQHTGISVCDLREFSAGRLALSALQRLHIFTTVAWFKDRWLAGCDPELLAIARRNDPQPDAERVARCMSAVEHLWREAKEELDEERRTKGENKCRAPSVQ